VQEDLALLLLAALTAEMVVATVVTEGMNVIIPVVLVAEEQVDTLAQEALVHNM
jgi:hypothetical protein